MAVRTLVLTAFLLSITTAVCAQSQPLDAVEADRLRIRAHLEKVEDELCDADVSHLTPEQRHARALNIERLRAYRERGVFPHGNPEQPAMRSPTFIDADGRACAMGHLVIASGHRDVAETIARDQNYARVPEITHPALTPWLEANGMTLAEATRVQPSYCFEACQDAGAAGPVCGSDGTAYQNECLAECAGASAVGPAQCDATGCSCTDAGTPADDAGPPADAGTDIVAEGGCSAGAGPRRGGALVTLLALGLVMVIRRRRA